MEGAKNSALESSEQTFYVNLCVNTHMLLVITLLWYFVRVNFTYPQRLVLPQLSA